LIFIKTTLCKFKMGALVLENFAGVSSKKGIFYSATESIEAGIRASSTPGASLVRTIQTTLIVAAVKVKISNF
jgi:hypothetical protein